MVERDSLRKSLLPGERRDGSDGTRTRDLRRDRPSRAPRRLTTNASQRAHLQALLVQRFAPLAWLSQSSDDVWATSGPRNLVFRDNACTPRCSAGESAPQFRQRRTV
jgi:hypothetical protein